MCDGNNLYIGYMSGLPINTFGQANEYRKQYMAYLALQAQNDALNLRANQIYKQTGQPSRPPDMRTLTEKMGDYEEVKVQLLAELKDITDGQNALEAVSELTPDEIAFAMQMIGLIKSELKPRYARGVPALALVAYIKALLTKELATNGVSFTAQEATSQAILKALETGRMMGAPAPAFAPSISAMPTYSPPPVPSSATMPVDFLSPPAVVTRDTSAVTVPDTYDPPAPITRKRPALTDFSRLLQEKSKEMGFDPDVVEQRGQELEKERLAASRGAVPASQKQNFKDVSEFQSASWEKIRKWYADWSGDIPEMVGPAMESGELSMTGPTKGQLKYRPKFGVPLAKDYLMPAFEIYLRRVESMKAPATSGTGIYRRHTVKGGAIHGYGLGKKVAIDMTQGVQPVVPTYAPFGRYIINPNKLSRGILDLKSLRGGALAKYPQKELSANLTKIMKRILENRMPDEYDFKEMDLEDQHFLHALAKDAKINERLNIPTPERTKDDEMLNRFEILKGMLMAGNDGSEVIKEFKTLLVKLSNDGRLKKADAREILLDLAAMGH